MSQYACSLIRRIAFVLPLCGAAAALLGAPAAADAQTVLWSRQYGSTGNDIALAAIQDGTSNTITIGETTGTLPGQVNAGGTDAYIRKYDSAGNLLWSHQYGTSGYDTARAVSVDSLNNIFVAGYTSGSLGGPSNGDYDAYLRKYDSLGNLQWTRQFGNNLKQIALAVHNDSQDNVFISGETEGALPGQISSGGTDCFLRKYDSSGNELWTRQFGDGPVSRIGAIISDGTSNTIVLGETTGTLGSTSYGGSDVFLRKYDSSGNVVWTRQYGTAADEHLFSGSLVAFGDGSVRFVTAGSVTTATGEDAFVSQYDSDGQQLWRRQYGTGGTTRGLASIADGTSNTILVGETTGTLPGQIGSGGTDAYVRKYASDGTLLWTRQFGGSGFDAATGVALGANNSIYLSGYTGGSTEHPTLGNQDAYIVKWALPNLAPIARCKDVTVVAGPVCTAPASIDNGSSDPDPGDTISVQQIAQGPFGLGITTPVTLMVTDSHGTSSSCHAKVTVVDQTAPLFSAVPVPITIGTGAGATSCSVTIANLGAVTATDNCGVSSITRAPNGNVFPVGTTIVTYTAKDGSNNPTAATQTIIVNDTTPPAISALTASPATIARNQQVTPVTISYAATDNCPGVNTCQLTVTSNQPSNSGDFVVVDANHVQLLGERSGNSDRVYTITATCADAHNNVSTKSTQVNVSR